MANVREVDPEDVRRLFQNEGCEIKQHLAGYRSVHYLVEWAPARDKVIIEVQVRTLFGEARSEIDHTVRYTYHTNDPVLFEFLSILNRFDGSADEMGSFISALQEYERRTEAEVAKKGSQNPAC